MQLIKQILDAVMAINLTTDHAAFFNISGHVEKVEVWVVKSKTEYSVWIYEANVFMAFPGDEDYDEEAATEGLDKMLKGLQQFLPQQSVTIC